MTGVVTRSEILSPGPAEALAGLLGVPLPDLYAGGGLPLGWHWVHLLDRPAQGELGGDGHPAHPLAAPPEPGWRRMWGGGSLRCEGHLRIGEEAVRRSWVTASTAKRGRGGRLRLVEVTHEVSQRGDVVLRERQDILYREPGTAPASTSDSVLSAAGEREPPGWRVPIDPTLLFRFSALTYNAHRIHYDRDYATRVEGYPGLLVHGPLQALVMAERMRAAGVVTEPGVTFEYRLEAPLFDHQGLRVLLDAGDATRAWIEDDAGRRTASAEIRLTRSTASSPSELR